MKKTTLFICTLVLILIAAGWMIITNFSSNSTVVLLSGIVEGTGSTGSLDKAGKWQKATIQAGGKTHTYEYRKYQTITAVDRETFKWANESLTVSPFNTVLTLLSWESAGKTDLMATAFTDPDKILPVIEEDHKKRQGKPRWARTYFYGEVKLENMIAVVEAVSSRKDPENPIHHSHVNIIEQDGRYLIQNPSSSRSQGLLEMALSFDNWSVVTGAAPHKVIKQGK